MLLSFLSALAHLRERFPYSLQQDILWAHCCWECIMTWKDDAEVCRIYLLIMAIQSGLA